jgi:hypothetical protein
MDDDRDDFDRWIDRSLADVGVDRRGPIVTDRFWARALLVTFETDRGRMWAKAVPGVFAHEVGVTLLLADIDPGSVPPVVAADPTLGRIITEHVEGPVLAALDGRPDAWAATASRLAELQRVVAADRTALAVAGVVPAPVHALADAVPRLLADDELLATGRPDGLTVDEVATLRARAPELVAACHLLAAGGVPDSLEHGDLTADEVILGEMGPVFLDWSDGSITHPFLSAASLLVDEDAADEAVAGYLGPWIGAGVVTDADGRTLLAQARKVLPLHLAALYADRILPALGRGDRTDPTVIEAFRTLVTR